MMEQHTLISLYRMRISTKDGTIILGLLLRPIKSLDITDSKDKVKDHVGSMKSN